MKMIDMGFWQVCFDLDASKEKNAHQEKCMDRFSEKNGHDHVHGCEFGGNKGSGSME